MCEAVSYAARAESRKRPGSREKMRACVRKQEVSLTMYLVLYMHQ